MKRVLFLLGQLTDKDIDWMIRNGTSDSLSAGKYLIDIDQSVDHVFIILSGRFCIRDHAGSHIASIGSGEVVGEMSFIDARPPSVSVVSEEDAMVFKISSLKVRQRMEVDQGFAARFYSAIAMYLSDRLRKTTSRLGYGPIQDQVDEIDPNVLNEVGRAGASFSRILQRFAEV